MSENKYYASLQITYLPNLSVINTIKAPVESLETAAKVFETLNQAISSWKTNNEGFIFETQELGFIRLSSKYIQDCIIQLMFFEE
jgi:hypothetical protein